MGGCIPGTNTLQLLNQQDNLKGKIQTYTSFVYDILPPKAEKNRVHITVGGNLIDYPFSVQRTTTDIITDKLLFNSLLSKPNTKFMTIDVKNIYLNTQMELFEYMCL